MVRATTIRLGLIGMFFILVMHRNLCAAEPLLEQVRPGMSQVEIAPYLLGLLQRQSFASAQGTLPRASCYRIDDRRSLVIEWPGEKMDSATRASAVRIVDFAEICRPLSGDALTDVLAVHAAPTIREASFGYRGDILLSAALRLHQAGRLRTLIAMRSYLEIVEAATLHGSDGDRRRLWEADGATDRLAWLGRLLFALHDVRATWAIPRLGIPDPPPLGPVWNGYPLVVSQGLPFLLVADYQIDSEHIWDKEPELPAVCIDFCDHECDWVVDLPIPSCGPAAAAEKLTEYPWVQKAFLDMTHVVTRHIRQQAYAMQRAIAPAEDLILLGPRLYELDPVSEEQRWRKIISIAQRDKLIWDTVGGAFRLER
jgi:hypothetical protein